MENISGFGLENFKIFKDKVNFDFAPLTVLTGTNNSGKSTVINAWKLLKEDFKEEKEVYKNIDQILLTNFDVHSLIDRYGHLSQFITEGSEKNKFSFSFTQKMIAINDEAEMIVTVRIKDNNLRDGEIVDYKMRSIKEDKIIFHIYGREREQKEEDSENKSDKKEEKSTSIQSVIKIDLVYFYEQLVNRIKRNLEYREDIPLLLKGDLSLEGFNKKYDGCFTWSSYKKNGKTYKIINWGEWVKGSLNPDQEPEFVIGSALWKKTDKDDFKKIINELNEHGLYNFSFILKNETKKIKFEKVLKDFYGEGIDKVNNQISKDILQFLSEVEWTDGVEGSGRIFGNDSRSVVEVLCSREYSIRNDPNRNGNTNRHREDFGFTLQRFINTYGLGMGKIRTSLGDNKLDFGKKYNPKRSERSKNIFNQLIEPLASIITSKMVYRYRRLDHDNLILSNGRQRDVQGGEFYKV